MAGGLTGRRSSLEKVKTLLVSNLLFYFKMALKLFISVAPETKFNFNRFIFRDRTFTLRKKVNLNV